MHQTLYDYSIKRNKCVRVYTVSEVKHRRKGALAHAWKAYAQWRYSSTQS
jgi:hypothetical protein